MLISVFCERSDKYIIDRHFFFNRTKPQIPFSWKLNCILWWPIIPRIPNWHWWVCLLTKNATQEFWACICMTWLKHHLDGLLVDNKNVATLFQKSEISNICKAYTFLCLIKFWCGFFLLWIYWTENFVLSINEFLLSRTICEK